MNSFIDRYIFPDGELAPVGSTVALLEEAGFEVRDVEALREHCAPGSPTWSGTGRRRYGSPPPSGPGYGGCTWLPRRSASSGTRWE